MVIKTSQVGVITKKFHLYGCDPVVLFVIITVNYSVFITLSWFIKELMNIFEPDQIWKSALEVGPLASVRH